MAITNIFGRDFYQGTDAEMAATTPRIDGALFWTTDTLKLYCYSGAAWNEVGGGGGGDVATDDIWDAKGDLAVGTGANTAAKLTVGADGKIIYADSGEATGLVWDDPPAVATDAIWDAKGDLAVGTGANTAAKLTVGADGKILYADSGEATGLLWDDPPAGTDVATDAIWDAKGDLAVGTGANTASKLTVGADGKILYADSGEATGLLWDDPPAGGGDSTLTSTYATRAAASNDGNLFLPSDGFVVERDTGAAYVPWGPLFPLTAPPDVSGWTWDNQASSSTSATKGGVVLTSGGASDSFLYKAAPSVPYVITMAFLADFPIGTTSSAGIFFRQSSDGKIIYFRFAGYNNNLYIFLTKMTNSTTFSAHYDYDAIGYYNSPLLWVRIADNNTNRICSLSADGQNWRVYHTVGRTDFLTADQVGMFAGATAVMTVLSWKET